MHILCFLIQAFVLTNEVMAIALIALEGIKNKGSNEIVWREDI